MNFRDRLFYQMSNIGKAYRRYPLTMLLLILLTVTNAWYIVDEFSGYERLFHSFLVAITISLVAAHLNERFIQNRIQQLGLLSLSVALPIIYYFLLPPKDAYYFITEVRTAVLIFTLFIAFIWIPSIKNTREYFYQYFLAAFKYSFTTILYALILTLGIQSIISTVDYLFFSVSYDYFMHATNIIWFIFATSYFLSLMPETCPYLEADPTADEEDHSIDFVPFEVTNFLKILINYIVIPLIGIYTFILLVYIGLNIRVEFWTDNLLEPMLISYTIVLILVYLLASNINEAIANFFRKVFPKILILIVLFQTIASFLKIREAGVSYGRYYVILFGIFSLIAGLIFSFLPKERSGLIVPVLIALAFLSLTPPVDAFTIAEKSQKDLLTDVLTKNEMLAQNKVQLKSDINQKDKERITSTIEYLETHEYIEDLAYLPKDFEVYADFEQVFGFPMTYEDSEIDNSSYNYASLDRLAEEVIDISAEDYFVELHLDNYDESTQIKHIQINQNYFIRTDSKNAYPQIDIENKAGDKLLEINLEALFEQAFAASSNEGMVGQKDMTLIAENEDLGVNILALELMKNENDEKDEEDIVSTHLYLFLKIKD